ncbi:hypothetical protein BC829DRAFT_383628 [Chytridium lagenaria]|nr:hypothetical protein BC829DRAFT_383628 [Chytridium lagenaria]
MDQDAFFDDEDDIPTVDGGYWDVDDFLAESQKIPCFFQSNVPKYGFLEGNLEDDLSKDARVELPFWLAEPLASENLVEIEYPRCFRPRIRNDIIASPIAINIQEQCPFFYHLGSKLVQLVDDLSLSQILSMAYSTRLVTVMEHAQSQVSLGSSKEDFMRTLDESEKKVFKLANVTVIAMREWFAQRFDSKLKTAEVLRRSQSMYQVG